MKFHVRMYLERSRGVRNLTNICMSVSTHVRCLIENTKRNDFYVAF